MSVLPSCLLPATHTSLACPGHPPHFHLHLLLQAFLTKFFTKDLPALITLPKRLEINIPPAVTAGAHPALSPCSLCCAVLCCSVLCHAVSVLHGLRAEGLVR